MEGRLGVFADTGSAFINNHYQLDYLLGSYSSKKGFYKAAGQIGQFCEVYVLNKKMETK